MNSEESYVLASLKEFVRIWGSGNQASFSLECRNGQACFKMASQLGHPASQHFVPHPFPRQYQHHGPHGAGDGPQHRIKGPGQRRRDRARAAAHQARLNDQLTEPRLPAATATHADSEQVPPPPLPTAAPAAHKPPPPDSLPILPHLNPPAATAGPPTAPPPDVPTEPTIIARAVSALDQDCSEPVLIEVKEEILPEEKIVLATAVFENCPDENLSQDYSESLRRFILSEDHLQKNLGKIEMGLVSTRRSNSGFFLHSVLVRISVKTTRLWEPARDYIYKHLGSSDWLRGNKTRIYLMNIHV